MPRNRHEDHSPPHRRDDPSPPNQHNGHSTHTHARKPRITKNGDSLGRNDSTGHKNYTVREVPLEEWDNLLEHFPTHTVFHTSPWLQTIEAVHGAKVRLLRADANRRCAAIWPVFVTRKGPLRILGSPLPGWSTAYLGPVFNSRCDVDQALAALLKNNLLRRCSYFACKLLHHENRAIDLTPYGFDEALQFETYCLDLTQPRQTLWDNLKSECRTRIRKAQKLGLELRHEEDSSFIDEYWAMSIETFANTKIQPMFTKAFINELWRRLHPTGQICALSAWLNGQRIAIFVLPFDQHTMYYWGGASFLRWRAIPAHNFLQWEAIELAQRLGLQRYDFISTLGGAGRFKKTFGPQTIHSATHWERTSSRLIKALKNGYEQYLMLKQRVKVRD